jgi:hypothetical protein
LRDVLKEMADFRALLMLSFAKAFFVRVDRQLERHGYLLRDVCG